MAWGITYIVVNEGEVVYASDEEESAIAYADNANEEACLESLGEMGIDDPSEKDLAEAAFQAGYDGGCYEVERVDLTDKTEDDVISISDGSEIDVTEILEKLDCDEE